MALPKRPHDEEKHPRTHGGRFDKKPTHSYDREKKKWVAVTEGPGEISPEKPAGEVKPDAGPPVVKPDAVKVHSAKEHEARVMGEAKQAEQKPATAAHLGMVQDQYVLPGTEKAVAEAMENEAQASRLIRGAGVHQDIALKAIREGKEVAAKHASNPEMKAKDVADEVEGAFREAGVTADHPKVRQAAESLAGTAIAKGTSEGTRKNTPGKINRQLNGEVLTHEELKAEAADFADKRATGRELANKLQHTEDKASVTNWGSNYLPQSGRLASNAITTIDTESATNPNFATSLKNRSKDGFKRLAHADVEREFSSAAVKARENPPLRDAGVFHGGANAQPARHFVTHDGQTVAVDEGQHAILKKATGFDELRESSGKSGSPIVAYRGGKPVGMIKGGASPYGVEAGHTVAPSPTNSLGEPVSPFVASLKAGQPAAATTVRKPPRQDETKQQQRDRARKERPEADRIAAQANAEFDARMQAKTAPTPFQPPADFHTAEAARHAALATDHRKKGDFAAAADASAKSLSHRKQAAALKGEPLSVPANPAQDREGARAEPAAEPANATTTPAAGKPSTGHGGHPDTKLTLWQDHATGKQRVYLNHPSLRPFGTGGKRAIAAYIHEGPGGKLELHQHGTQFPEREAQQIAAPLLAKHQTMESLAAHATVGKSAKEYASSAWKQYLPQGAENQTGTAAEYQRATAAHEQRVTALVKKDSPRLSHLEATREAKRRIFKATERSLHEFRQNDGLPLSRSLADAEIPDGVLVFSVSGLGEVSESPAMGQNRPKEVNGIPARYYWKKMLAPGVIHHPDPKVGLVNVTPEDIRAIDKNTRDWIKTEGGKPRVPPTHKGTTTNYGWIIDTKVDENGTLCGLHQLIGSDAHQAAARNESSVGLRRNFKSGRSGRTFSLLLEHNAIVSDPVQEGLGNFIPLSRTIAA